MYKRLDYLRAGLKKELTSEEIAKVWNMAFMLDSRLDVLEEDLQKAGVPERDAKIVVGSSRHKVEMIYEAVCNPLPKENDEKKSQEWQGGDLDDLRRMMDEEG